MRGRQMDCKFSLERDINKTAFRKRLLKSFRKKGGK